MSSCGVGILSLNGMFSSGSAGVIDWTLLVQVWIASMTAVWLLLIVFRISSCSSRPMVRASVMAPPRGLYVANYTKHSVDLSSEGSPAPAEVRHCQSQPPPERAAAGSQPRTYSPGASARTAYLLLPIAGGRMRSPARPCAHLVQSSHQEPLCLVGGLDQPAASAGLLSAASYHAFGPGGLTMPATWPPLDRTYRTSPPSSLVAWYDACQGTM